MSTKTSLENVNPRYLYYHAIIPMHSTCTIWLSYPLTKQVQTALVLVESENEDFTVISLHSAQKLELVIPRCRLAEYGEKMQTKNQNPRAKPSLNTFFFSRSRCRRRFSYLNSLLNDVIYGLYRP